MDPLDCCMTTSFTAMSCYAKHYLGQETYPVTARGNVTLYIDSWSVNLTSTHKVVLGNTDDVMNFNVKDPMLGPLMNWNCSDIQFTDL